MTLARFVPTARFERRDLLAMRDALDRMLARSGRTWPERASDLVSQAQTGLLEALGNPPAPRAGWRQLGPRPSHRTGGGEANPGLVPLIELAAERLLDAAAQLLDASEILLHHGELVEAFSLEGIQGRLLEAAIGAGRLESGWVEP